MAETGMQPFDLKQAAENLRAQIRSSLLGMVSDEQLDQMVKVEWREFIQGQGNGSFRHVCGEIFREHVKKEVLAELSKPDWYGRIDVKYGSGGPVQTLCVGDAIKAWLTENRQALVQTVLMELMGNAAQRVVMAAQGRY